MTRIQHRWVDVRVKSVEGGEDQVGYKPLMDGNVQRVLFEPIRLSFRAVRLMSECKDEKVEVRVSFLILVSVVYLVDDVVSYRPLSPLGNGLRMRM